jgi:RNA polymerase sigma-70 factor (ECF subfamily)
MSRTEMPTESRGERDYDAVIAQAKLGHPDALTELWKHYNPLLLRYLRVILSQDWEDVASETWIGVARSLAGFSGTFQGFEALLFTVARRRVVDHVRRRGARPVTVSITGFQERPEIAETPEEIVVAQSSVAEIVDLLRRLPPAQAEVVFLRTVSGLEVSEIATIVGKTAGSVRVLSHRGLVQLHALIESQQMDAAAREAKEEPDSLRMQASRVKL